DGVRRGERAQAVRRLDYEPGLGGDAAPVRPDHEEAVPRIGDLAPVRAEHLARDREVELDHPVGEDDRDGVHGRKLAEVVSETQVPRGRVRSWTSTALPSHSRTASRSSTSPAPTKC